MSNVNITNKLFLSFFLIFSFSFSAFAQEVEEVVVTATKKEESIQDIAVSIQAFDADSLAAEQIYDLSDLAEVVPGFEVSKSIGSGVSLYCKRNRFFWYWCRRYKFYRSSS